MSWRPCCSNISPIEDFHLKKIWRACASESQIMWIAVLTPNHTPTSKQLLLQRWKPDSCSYADASAPAVIHCLVKIYGASKISTPATTNTSSRTPCSLARNGPPRRRDTALGAGTQYVGVHTESGCTTAGFPAVPVEQRQRVARLVGDRCLEGPQETY